MKVNLDFLKTEILEIELENVVISFRYKKKHKS